MVPRRSLDLFSSSLVIVGGSGRLIGPVVRHRDPLSGPERAAGRSRELPPACLRRSCPRHHAGLPDGVVGTIERARAANRARERGFRHRFQDGAARERGPARRTHVRYRISIRGARKAYGKDGRPDRHRCTVVPSEVHAIVGPNGSAEARC